MLLANHAAVAAGPISALAVIWQAGPRVVALARSINKGDAGQNAQREFTL